MPAVVYINYCEKNCVSSSSVNSWIHNCLWLFRHTPKQHYLQSLKTEFYSHSKITSLYRTKRIYSDLAAQWFKTKSREHAPAFPPPPPTFTDKKKSTKRSTFCSKRPPTQKSWLRACSLSQNSEI